MNDPNKNALCHPVVVKPLILLREEDLLCCFSRFPDGRIREEKEISNGKTDEGIITRQVVATIQKVFHQMSCYIVNTVWSFIIRKRACFSIHKASNFLRQ